MKGQNSVNSAVAPNKFYFNFIKAKLNIYVKILNIILRITINNISYE